MKKLFKISTLIISGLLMIACTDLEVGETDSQFIEKTEGGISGDPAQLLETNYNDLGALTDQAGVYALFTHTTDEMIPPTRGVDWGDNGVWRTLHAHTWDPAHAYVLSSWNILNERVYRCNLTLASSPTAQQEAEAKLLRAFYMHQVLDLYGQVPFREVDQGVDEDPTVFSKQEAFDFIMDDLTSSVANLPSIGPGSEQHQASKAAAYFLIAKMHLNRGVYTGTGSFESADMTAVIDNIDLLEAEGYSLDPDYFNIFHPTTSANEVILQSPSGNPANRIYMTTHYSQNPSGWNGFTTLADFYNTVLEDVNDQRLGKGPGSPNYVFDQGDFTPDIETSGIGYGFLIGSQYNDDGTKTIDSRTQQPLEFSSDVPLAGASTEKGIRVMKYHPTSSTFDTRNYILMRFADAHLMRTEALLRSGNSAQALIEINELRLVRGAGALASVSEADILDERGRELYWEGGRRTDQIRFGTFTSQWSEKTVTEEHRVLFPIPAQALASNPNLSQNDGY